MSKYIRLGLICFIIFAIVINIIITWNIIGSEFLKFIALFVVNVFAILSSLIQLWLYLEDEHIKDEIHQMYQKEFPPSTDELRREFEKLFGK